MSSFNLLTLLVGCLAPAMEGAKQPDPVKPAKVSFWDRVRTDYGKPAFQYEAGDVEKLAGKALNKKITVRGEVTKVDVTNPKHCLVTMKPGITFDFLNFQAAAEACKVGETVYIDGILKRHDKNQILLAPSFTRDPNAPFTPIRTDDGKKTELQSLQGKWNAVAYIEDGEAATRLEKTPISWEFKEDKLTIRAEDQQVFTIKGSFTLDPATKPKNIEIKIDKRDDFPEQTMPGIYKIENDTLVVCYATEGKRPTAFESKAGSNLVLITLKQGK
ncbi:MAG: TIGR03067 domain-containing protein [Gemmatales bacterium]